MKNDNKVFDKIRLFLKNALLVFRKKQVVVALGFSAAMIVMSLIAVLTVSLSVKAVTGDNIVDAEKAGSLEEIDYILVLGAGLRPDGSPSDMLSDRLSTGISLLHEGFDGGLILSGDNSGADYNEVGAMKDYALDAGVDESIIVADDYGFSTYESIYRAKHEYNAERIIIVTQGYHLYRALYIAEELGIEAYGVSADVRSYRGQTYRDIREHVARLKDFFVCLLYNADIMEGK